MKKRWFILLLTALALVLLCACAGERGDPNVYDVDYGGRTYHVDLTKQTISYDDVVCQFKVSDSSFSVVYPDGSSWRWSTSGGSSGVSVGYGGWSDDYDENRYVPGETLWNVLGGPKKQTEKTGNPLLGLILIVVGVVNAVKPEIGWQLSYGWRYKDAEPSDMALMVGRLGGVLAIIIGIICMFV